MFSVSDWQVNYSLVINRVVLSFTYHSTKGFLTLLHSENRENALAQIRLSSYLVQWCDMTKEVQIQQAGCLITGCHIKRLLVYIVLAQWPHPFKVMPVGIW